MKKILCFILSLLTCIGINAQCPNEFLTLNNQAEVDAFLTDYPNCSTIISDVFVSGEDVTNLNGLSEITSISDDDIHEVGLKAANGFGLYEVGMVQ